MEIRRLATVSLACLAAMASFALPAAAGVGEWTSIGPDGAYVSTLVVDPSDPQILYAGTPVTGVFKSENGGTTWFAANQGLPDLDLPDGGVGTIAIDPLAPSVLYATSAGGIYRTTDAGGHWFFAASLAENGYAVGINSLACDPTEPGTLYAGGFETAKVWVSRDSGVHWQVAESLPAPDTTLWVVTDPVRGLVYSLAARLDSVYRLHVSSDHGRTWRDLSAALPSPALVSYGLRINQGQLVVDPGPGGALYLAYPGNAYDQVGPATYQSTDLGQSWHAVGPGGFPISVGPNHAIYAGSVRSLDGGHTWTPMGAIAEPVNCYVVAGSTLYAGAQTLGVLRSVDFGKSFEVRSHGLRTSEIVAFTLDPTDPAKVFAYSPTSNGALVASRDGGHHWLLPPAVGNCVPPGGCGLDGTALLFLTIAVDPLAPSTIYLASADGLQRSTDGGRHIYPLYQYEPGSSCLNIETFALDPFVSGTLYGTGGFTTSCIGPGGNYQCDAFRSTDGGETWGCLSVDASLIVASRSDPGRLYAIGFRDAYDQNLYTSVDRGDTWTLVNEHLPPNSEFTVLLVDPVDPARLYAADDISGDVWSSPDGGKHWKNVLSPELGPALLAIDPIQPQNIYVALQGLGVLHSADRGSTWEALTRGFPPVGYIYNQIATDPRRSGTVYLATVTNAILSYTVPQP
jgi:photosystem II stability/assembly factor-like uncharacterized protein